MVWCVLLIGLTRVSVNLDCLLIFWCSDLLETSWLICLLLIVLLCSCRRTRLLILFIGCLLFGVLRLFSIWWCSSQCLIMTSFMIVAFGFIFGWVIIWLCVRSLITTRCNRSMHGWLRRSRSRIIMLGWVLILFLVICWLLVVRCLCSRTCCLVWGGLCGICCRSSFMLSGLVLSGSCLLIRMVI